MRKIIKGPGVNRGERRQLHVISSSNLAIPPDQANQFRIMDMVKRKNAPWPNPSLMVIAKLPNCEFLLGDMRPAKENEIEFDED